MIPEHASIQIAHALLTRISRHDKPTYRLFYQDYRSFFSVTKVPAVNQIYNSAGQVVIVDVDCTKAIEYLKNKFNFYDSNELTDVLQEEAKHHAV